MDTLKSEYRPQICFIYNGTSIFTYAAKIWAKKLNIKTLFFELANISGKMFIDPCGTNAKSKLYNDIDLLNEYYVDTSELSRWLDDYKKNKNSVKQALVSRKLINLFIYAINKLWFISYVNERSCFFYNELMQFINSFDCFNHSKIEAEYETTDINLLTPYYLFPMQVSVDSQVLLNSDISLKDAVEYVKKEAKNDDVKLIIKLHPAERDKNIRKYLDTIRDENIIIVNQEYRLNELLENAKKVITINSTVGLEAILYDKDVEFLGKSVYKYFLHNKELLSSYIFGYLVSIDYFSNDSIDVDIVKKCLSRAG